MRFMNSNSEQFLLEFRNKIIHAEGIVKLISDQIKTIEKKNRIIKENAERRQINHGNSFKSDLLFQGFQIKKGLTKMFV